VSQKTLGNFTTGTPLTMLNSKKMSCDAVNTCGFADAEVP